MGGWKAGKALFVGKGAGLGGGARSGGSGTRTATGGADRRPHSAPWGHRQRYTQGKYLYSTPSLLEFKEKEVFGVQAGIKMANESNLTKFPTIQMRPFLKYNYYKT